MFKTIVLALDGSEGSRRAIPVAAELARQNGGRIVIAHVEQDVAGKGGAPIPVTEDEIQAEIREQAKRLAADGIETSVEMRNVMLGGPAHPIAEIAEAWLQSHNPARQPDVGGLPNRRPSFITPRAR